ncbi:type II secretion system F family protein [Actomonas aquatica]|uniref:General secretion pathway protein F n=1 Tax=Actomonas aquatica TaxID=2866162 RepID=A0ABZ1CBU2_9BACT|nr:type II secretion system F family protein [Opitutus sp. WL0086]WRQ88044.1 type II secretion system F family protein [Opitutus sp. WL0086]
MPSYTYIAIDANTGKERRGSCVAASVAAASADLKSQGLFPTDVIAAAATAATESAEAGASRGAGAKLSKGLRKPRGASGAKARTLFTRQLATMLKAGMPLLRAIEVLERQQRPGPLRTAVSEVAETIRGGGTLSDGLARHPKLFNRLYLNMVRAGEASGALDVVLLRLAEFLEKAQRVRGKIKAAMTYPLIIMGVTVLVVGALVLFVVPRFEEMFTSMQKGRALPVLTQAVLSLSEWVQHNVLWLVLGLIVLGVGVWWGKRTTRGERLVDRLALSLPVLGELSLKSAVARFTRTLGTLLGSGVQILDALQITRDTAGNVHIAEAVDAVRLRVKAGEGVARPLEETGVFPGMVPSMIEVGEETGQLPDMLERVADTYEEEVDNAVVALTSILEPAMIVMMAVVVGTIVLALFLPLMGLVQSLS